VIAAKARDRDPAEFIKVTPLIEVGLEIGTIGRGVGQRQALQPARNPLAHLAADFAEAWPMRAKLRQSPLQEQNAFVISHERIETGSHRHFMLRDWRQDQGAITGDTETKKSQATLATRHFTKTCVHSARPNFCGS
jgi:hypothetical protein